LIDFNLSTLIAFIPALLIGLSFHEFAHAWAADYLGDPTPRSQGRLTINPLAHLDIFGTIMILLYHFGWAKPVQVNPNNFRGNPLRGHMLVSLAGPAMNLIIAFFGMIIWGICEFYMQDSLWWPNLYPVLTAIVTLNIGLGVFNLIPIPPLDGFSILGGLLPRPLAQKFWSIEPYGILILMVLLFTNILSPLLSFAVRTIFYVYQYIVSHLLALFIR